MVPDRLPAPPPADLPPDLADALAGAPGALRAAAAHACAHAPFLRALMRRRPAVLAGLAAGGWEAALTAAHALARDETQPPAARLRRARGDVALITALADIAGVWDLGAVTRALSDFADLALSQAIAAAIRERVPGAPAEGFVALALGKQGSRELNYSSDLDLIFLFDRETLPRRPREDADEAAVRIGRRVVELMQARDAEGYVARIDLRLRPSPEATPIALSIPAALHYYQAEALPWERAAFIRARAVAGDMAAGDRFLAEIAPFVWRRSLDFQAIREVQAISLRIRDHYEAGQAIGPGFDLKRGRGGIREVEFFAQMHQMIFGGRDPALRAPATLDALAALAEAGRVPAQDARALSAAYHYLRAAEHRAQMVEDAQTHAVPEQEAARESYARFAGYADWPAMADALGEVTSAVAPVFDRVGIRPEPPTPSAALPADLEPLLAAWREGRRRGLRTAAARTAFAEVEPALVAELTGSSDPRGAITRFDRFLDALPAGVGFFALLASNPPLVALLARLLTAAPMLADALARRPALFDVLFDPEGDLCLNRERIEAELAATLRRAPSEEAVLEAVRHFVAERRFQIGAQLVEGQIDALEAGRAYGCLADAAVSALHAHVTRSYAEQNGAVEGAELVVLALGRYGGGRLTARSDLDLVLIHTGAGDAVADNPRATPAATYFNRLGQRLVAALTVPTAAGALYQVDTRLRPSGAKGLLVVPVETFARYQREEAWPAEHLALTRARVAVGSPGARAEVERAIEAAIGLPRDMAAVRAAAASLRREMGRHKRHGGLYDVKLAPGGLVDLELVLQVRQLEARRRISPDLREVTLALAPELLPAQELLTRVLILQRLIVPETSGPLSDPPPAAEALMARATGHDAAAELHRAIAAAKDQIRNEWRRTFGGGWEDQ